MNQLLRLLLLYLLFISILTFFLFGLDKSKARRSAWRISERTLLLLCTLGGCYGGLAGMYVFHHKTKKPKFFVLIPALCLVWTLFLWFFSSTVR